MIPDFATEKDVEDFVRQIISDEITRYYPEIYALNNKKAVDIVVCSDRDPPHLFFLEIKLHKYRQRIGFGGSAGRGFQPEILTRDPRYLRDRLRWVFASSIFPNQLMLLTSQQASAHVVGGTIGPKHNNFSPKLIDSDQWMDRSAFTDALRTWLLS